MSIHRPCSQCTSLRLQLESLRAQLAAARAEATAAERKRSADIHTDRLVWLDNQIALAKADEDFEAATSFERRKQELKFAINRIRQGEALEGEGK